VSRDGGASSRDDRRWRDAIGPAIAVGGLALVGWTIVDQWSEITSEVGDASWGWLAGSVVLALAAMVAIGLPWGRALRLVGGQGAPTRRLLAWFLAGQVGKYVPGGVWPVVGRAELAVRGGVPRVPAYSSTALSLATTNVGCALAAALAFPFAARAEEGDARSGAWVLPLLLLSALLLHPRVLSTVLRLARRAVRRPDLDLVVPPWRATAALVLLHLPGWALVGAATYAVARALDPSPPIAPIVFATFVSWVAGMVVVPVPGGLGVREVVFAGVASTALPAGLAATVALLARLVFMAADAGGVALAVPLGLDRRAVLAIRRALRQPGDRDHDHDRT
jgi:hypothetical protein